jgi:sec-independent protein translocase protein TatA
MHMGQHWEILIPVLLIALLFFGTKRLPEMGSAIGKTIKEFQKSMREVTEPEQPSAAVPPATPVERPQLSQPSAPATPGPSAAATAETKATEPAAS